MRKLITTCALLIPPVFFFPETLHAANPTVAVSTDPDVEVTLENFAVVNPPLDSTKTTPTAKDFERVFGRFFAADHPDTSKESLDSQLALVFHDATPNGLFKLLKLREKDFRGAIAVTPVAEDNKMYVVVTARIVEDYFLGKVMHMRAIFIEFAANGKLVEIERGPKLRQELEKRAGK